MKKLLINIILFFLIAIIIGEVIVRLTHATADIPQRTIDEYGIQKYFPNQEGYWKGGNHQWMINNQGWPGELPKSYDNLITIIGDSYIENFINPNKCHQSFFLKTLMPKYNFFEAGRSGVSLIEAMEISKQIDSLNPELTLIYVNDNDFYESIQNKKILTDITQVNLTNDSIIYGKMKSPGLKNILYSWKLLYYFYNRFPLSSRSEKEEAPVKHNRFKDSNVSLHNQDIINLVNYITKNYYINSKIFVFHPNSSKEIIDICKNNGFKVIVLDSSNDKTWTFDYDSHWTCYGHQKVAEQVQSNLTRLILKN